MTKVMLNALNQIAKSHYETGKYTNHHLAIRPDDLRMLPKSEKSPGFDPGHSSSLAQLTGIPIVCDDKMPLGQWELRENRSRRMVTWGLLYVANMDAGTSD